MDREFIQIERSQGAWHLIFQKLHQIARSNAGSQQIAKKPMNAIRNRYRDVLPIDDTRVKLDNEDNDYINANFVTAEEVNRRYILSQGPLQHTCPHFWQMIWEQNSAAIVMLNKCIERGMNKCFPYWPLAEDPPLEAGKFHIENLGTEDESCFRLSHLKLINTETEESRVVMHYHYTQWPDFGVPQNPDVFLEFLYAVRGGGALSPDVGPAVVHCSAGIGRSGTFCLVDVLLAKLEQTRDLSTIDLQQMLLMMRSQRLGLIQTPDQLRFSYIAVLQGALQDLELEPSNYDDLSDSEGDEPEEESEEESDSDEEVAAEDRYPNLTRQYGRTPTYDADDAPPPLPPRPPDTLTYDSEDSDTGHSPPPEVGHSPPPSPPPMFHHSPPPPPPPSSLPPGPPSIHSPEELGDDVLPKKIIRLDQQTQNHDDDEDIFDNLHNGEEYGFTISHNDDSEPEEEEEEEHALEQHEYEVSGKYDKLEPRQYEASAPAPDVFDNHNDVMSRKNHRQGGAGYTNDSPPPPVPPRSHSLSPSPNQTPYHEFAIGGQMDIYGDSSVAQELNGTSTRPFLGQGRGGGDMSASPPLPVANMDARSTAVNIATPMSPDDHTPPPLPAKRGQRKPMAASPPSQHLQDIKEEEQALISMLDELERSISRTVGADKKSEAVPVINQRMVERVGSGGRSDENLSPAEKRMVDRQMRRERISNKVKTIKEHLKQSDENSEEWSIPWLMVGFIVILGYCAYYVMQ